MIQVLKYLFCKLYFFYGKVLGIKYNTFLYPSAGIGFILAFNWVAIITLFLFYIDVSVDELINYWAVGGVVVICAMVVYMWIGGRYKKILKEVEHYSKSQKEKLKRNGVIYISVSIILTVLMMYSQLTF